MNIAEHFDFLMNIDDIDERFWSIDLHLLNIDNKLGFV